MIERILLTSDGPGAWTAAEPGSRSDRPRKGPAVARRKRREGHSLHKVLGVGALFSTAYGNVGSSIYYALGVVAVAALGLTPAVFVITGCLFIATAWSYSEATAAMPEAGGASSFTRRAFNEFASFGIGWAQMLTYTATIAISALFVPQYLSIFWPILKEPPYNVIGGAITIVVLVVLNIVGIKEAASLNVVLALLDLGTQVLIMIIALVLLLEPNILIDADPLGRRADLEPVPLRPRHGHRRLHRHRDHLQHGGGGAPPGQGRAALHELRHHRRARGVHRHAAGGPVRDERRHQHGARRPGHRHDGARPGRPRRAGGHVRAEVRSRRSTAYVPVETLAETAPR